MKGKTVKFTTANEVEEVSSIKLQPARRNRIDEEKLFNLFTASIIRLKTKFTR
jgi:hypothetical protein